MNRLDKTIGYFSPSWQAKRSKARLAIASMSRGFEAASKKKRTEGWKTISSLNSDLKKARKTIVERSRYLAVNNAYAKRGVGAIPNHVVRRGIIPNISNCSRRFERDFKKWAKSNSCDYEGRLNFYGLQWLAMKTIVESGEVIIRLRTKKNGNLKLQVIEPDFIDSNRPNTKQGIEFNDDGEKVAYWLYTEHPNERRLSRLESIRVPANQIIHAFETLRPGQLRGIPWLVAVIIRLKDFDEFEDAQLVRQKIASCLVGVIHDIEMDEPTSKMKEEEWSSFTPGSWEIMPPGKTVTFSNPPQIQGYSEYTSAQLHAISAGIGVPYEVLTNDYSKVNFSSSRMSYLEFYKTVEHWQDHIVVGQICNPIFEKFQQLSEIGGLGGGDATVSWGLPKREYIDPGKEIKPQILAIRSGLTTLFEELRKSGYDPEDVLEEYSEVMDFLDKKNLTLDSDPRTASKGKLVAN